MEIRVRQLHGTTLKYWHLIGGLKGYMTAVLRSLFPAKYCVWKKKTLSRISLQIKHFRIVQMKQKLLRSWSIAHARLLLPTMVARLCLAFAKSFFAWSSLLILGEHTLFHLMEMLQVRRMTPTHVAMATHRHCLSCLSLSPLSKSNSFVTNS